MIPADVDIIMLPLPRWDGQYSSTAFSLAKELSRFTRVFYLDNPFTYKDYWTNRKAQTVRRREKALLSGEDIFVKPDRDAYPNLTAVTPRLTFPINWLPPGFLYERMAKINDGIVYEVIQKTITEFNIHRFIFINSFNPLFGRYFPASFKPMLKVYHSVDDIRNSAYVAKHGTRLEGEMVAAADLTLVTSSELRRLKAEQGKHVYLLPNAADTKLFQKAMYEDLPVPFELKPFADKKIICYTGNICHRLDYELLLKIARDHADKILLMVGPFGKDTYREVGLDKLPNVVFTGRKDISELPAYLKHSHCCIIPFRMIPLTKSIYPLKINEYLSAGKPVVTTRFSEDIANFEGMAYVSNSNEEFSAAITQVIEKDSAATAEDRVQYSSANDWKSRAEQLLAIVENHLQAYGTGAGRI